jgi:hypothetical protein
MRYKPTKAITAADRRILRTLEDRPELLSQPLELCKAAKVQRSTLKVALARPAFRAALEEQKKEMIFLSSLDRTQSAIDKASQSQSWAKTLFELDGSVLKAKSQDTGTGPATDIVTIRKQYERGQPVDIPAINNVLFPYHKREKGKSDKNCHFAVTPDPTQNDAVNSNINQKCLEKRDKHFLGAGPVLESGHADVSKCMQSDADVSAGAGEGEGQGAAPKPEKPWLFQKGHNRNPISDAKKHKKACLYKVSPVKHFSGKRLKGVGLAQGPDRQAGQGIGQGIGQGKPGMGGGTDEDVEGGITGMRKRAGPEPGQAGVMIDEDIL